MRAFPTRAARTIVGGALLGGYLACSSSGASSAGTPSDGGVATDAARDASSGASSGSSGASGSSSGSSSGGSGSGGSGGSSSGGASSSGGDSGVSPTDAGGPADGEAPWKPSSAQPIHFHWQLSDGFATADLLPSQQGQVVYDIDGEHATAADVAAIHGAGAKAVCYVDVGSLEQGRSDYSQFPASVVGPGVQGWPGENWLLVSAANQSAILPLMQARFQNWCRAKGFDAIEPDNLDAFTNISGVTETDNVAYDLAIASMGHGMGFSMGLKNLLTDVSVGNVASLLSGFDWALVEQCYEYSECSTYTQAGSFVALGKAVWDVEYGQAPTCSDANGAHMNAQERDLNLVAPTTSGYTYDPCIPDSQSTW